MAYGRKVVKRIIWAVLLLLAAGIAVYAYITYRGNTGMRFVREMGSGINIGNSLDVTGIRERRADADISYYETYWNNPEITRELFAMIKAAGFGTVRIPVSWEEHMDGEYQVQEAWMDRVEEVVGYALGEGLYVILDTHHESSWLIPTPEMEENTEEILCKLWSQIAERFIDYPEQLLFEGMNEPRIVDSKEEWSGGRQEEREVVNRLNEAFVRTVRAGGGNNESRWLLLTNYGGNGGTEALEAIRLPEDDRIIVSVHAYIPYRFALQDEGSGDWSSRNTEDTEDIDELMADLHRLFTGKKVPVIITEFGCMDKGNLQERVAWTSYYTEKAKEYGISCIWWDEGGKCRVLNRKEYAVEYPEIVGVLVGKK